MSANKGSREREEPASRSPGPRGRPPRRAGRIVLIRASLCRRLPWNFKALPWWHRGEEQPAVSFQL